MYPDGAPRTTVHVDGLTAGLLSEKELTANVAIWRATATSSSSRFGRTTSAERLGGIASATWYGPDGTSNTFFTDNTGNTIPSALQTNAQYFQYKVDRKSVV